MNDTTNLELTFENSSGKSKKLSIRRPVLGLTQVEILPVMETIVNSDIFDEDGIDPYVKAKNARYVRTEIEVLFENEEA
ncbi:DUF2922 domain-containing protein [Alkalibacterium sp. MB6]|uniref:DUF2922 domain-containing protein n=1 Tax=Alkalibacterium sp. MB6 TaxID=2081965 RepID=UPI001379FDD8|nr:DUF2922 domain-containing protein [Alkalibacterium sp. MB6]